VLSHDNGKSFLQELQSHIAYNPLTCETTNSIVLLKICSETETQDPKFQFALLQKESPWDLKIQTFNIKDSEDSSDEEDSSDDEDSSDEGKRR